MLGASVRGPRRPLGVLGGPQGSLGVPSVAPWGFLERLGVPSGRHWRSAGGARGPSVRFQGALGRSSEVLGGPRGALCDVFGRSRALLGTSERDLKIIEKTPVFIVFPAI